jgi:D-serine deaminase-like pyridoxal phosphate-dependent protein
MTNGAQVPLPSAPRLPAGLETPCLVIDLDIVEANARRMGEDMAARGIALRPHVKTHKSVALACIQLDNGAVGVTTGTIGEAEVMADGGIKDILVAYPVWPSTGKAERLRTLLERRALRLAVGVDSAAGATRLGRALGDMAGRMEVMIEVDPHYGRTGTQPDRAGALAAAARAAGMRVRGAFTHGGHGYAGGDAVGQAAEDEVEALRVAANSLSAAGFDAAVLSAGSSPTALGAARRPVTELRPGTYLVGDRQQVALGASPVDGVAICVAATVVSDAVEGQVVIDAGAKSLTKDRPDYLAGHGFLPAYPDGVLERVSDYHGVVRLPAGAPRPQVGEVVAVVPNHACPVVDLFDSFVVSRGGQPIGRWPVDARGRSG